MLYKKFLLALMLCFFSFNAEAVKGPVLVNVDVPPGKWKAIRFRNLPQKAYVALEIKSDGEIAVLLVDSADYQRIPNPHRPLFMGIVKDKLSLSVSIPKSGHYYVVFDNHSGRQQRAISMTAGAARGQTDSIDAANTILLGFEKKLHQIFIFDSFPIGVENCDDAQAFGDGEGILICKSYVQQLYSGIGDKRKVKEALIFSIFHELGRILLSQWKHPLENKITAADELGAVLMIMLNQKNMLSSYAERIVQDLSITDKLMKVIKDDRHPISMRRAKKILSWLKDPQFVRKWQKFLVPHMQTILLKKLQQRPTPWTSLPFVEKELAKRANIHT